MTDATTVQSLVLEGGRGAALVAALQRLAEAALDGEPRFEPAHVRAVERALVCRKYAPMLLELAHALAAASALMPQGRFENFFWAPGASVWSAPTDSAPRDSCAGPGAVASSGHC